MGKSLIVFVGLIYLGIAVEQYLKGNTGMAVTFLGYSIGNVGLMLIAT